MSKDLEYNDKLIQFRDVNTEPVMELRPDGSVYWNDGTGMRKVEMDKDLAQAFLLTTQKMAGKSTEAVINKIRQQERQRILEILKEARDECFGESARSMVEVIIGEVEELD